MKTRRRNYVSEDRLTSTQKNERENSLSIPVDLIIEIFSRLPAKSIARCRCLSKLWTSILVLPYFTELFLTKSLARPKLLFACYKMSEVFFFSSPEPQNPNEHSSPVAADRLMHVNDYFDISGPVHGLVCLIKKPISEGVVQIIICNPSTGEALPLRTINKIHWVRSDSKLRSLLGYDPIDKQFKVLLSMTWILFRSYSLLVEYQVLTLGTQELSWRMVDCCIPHYSSHKEICINGALYYPANKLSSKYITESSIMVCFDVRSEKFSFIEVKETCIRAIMNGTLINYNGKLGSLVCEKSRHVDGRSRSIVCEKSRHVHRKKRLRKFTNLMQLCGYNLRLF